MEDGEENPMALLQRRLGGILAESQRLLHTHARLFGALAATLVLPLSFMLLAHHLVSGPIVHKIHHDEAFISNPSHSAAADAPVERDLEQEWARLLLFFATYLLLVLGFSLLSTAAVVYSVACVYTQKSLSYCRVLSVVPTVWKRLLCTFLWVFLIIVFYHTLSIRTFVFFSNHFADANRVLGIGFLVLLAAFFMALHVYISCIWHLASVVTVLEESYGLQALKRSFILIKGKTGLAFTLFFIYLLAGGIIGFCFHVFVLHRHYSPLRHHQALRFLLGTALIALLSFVTLFGMIAQTVFYFACKSFHNEIVDWSALSEHLGAYLGEYVPLKSSIQMEALESAVY